jgi:hypothetical protein
MRQTFSSSPRFLPMLSSSLSLLACFLLSFAAAEGDAASLAQQGATGVSALQAPILLLMGGLVVLALVGMIIWVLIALFLRGN